MTASQLLRVVVLAAALAAPAGAVTTGWTPLTHQPTFFASTAFLLTDGRVLCNEVDASGFSTVRWWLLTPDSAGSYVNGTWSKAASANWTHLYFASGVFADGRVIVCGGEYSDAGSETNKTEIYNPVANTWTKLSPPTGWSNVGDAPSVVLTDGRLYIGDIFGQRTAFYDPVTNTWAAGPKKLNSQCGEESWTLLQDDTVLSVDCFGHPKTEKWLPFTNKWVTCGSTPVDLVLSGSLETGADVLRPNGVVFAIGGPPATALYTPPVNPADPGTWVAGPVPPKINGKDIGAEDAPACVLPNGNVLMALGPVTAGGGCSRRRRTSSSSTAPRSRAFRTCPLPTRSRTRDACCACPRVRRCS
ncbi:MAG: kelch repeat-containing protein [Planctomycetota bacterium]